ncbi:MAG: hypothetical protein ACR2KK_09890 [Acidimicrobiales bacterium]
MEVGGSNPLTSTPQNRQTAGRRHFADDRCYLLLTPGTPPLICGDVALEELPQALG